MRVELTESAVRAFLLSATDALNLVEARQENYRQIVDALEKKFYLSNNE